MCGIAGFIVKNKKFDRQSYVNDTIRSINHRGPDENGVFFENDICLLLNCLPLAQHIGLILLLVDFAILELVRLLIFCFQLDLR